MVNVCLEMRNINREIATSEKSYDTKKQSDIVHYISVLTNANFLTEINDETLELSKL